MKVTHWVIVILILLLGYMGWQNFVNPPPPPTTSLKEFTILLTENNGQLNLPGNQGCIHGPGPKEGCVRFGDGELGTIKFQITAGPKDKTCNDHPKPHWVITEIVLSAHGDPDTSKGDFTQSIPGWLTDAFPQTNSLTGVVYQADTSFGTSSAVVIDLNTNIGEKDIYYKVTASNCDGTETPVADPKIENKGRTVR